MYSSNVFSVVAMITFIQVGEANGEIVRFAEVGNFASYASRFTLSCKN